MSRLRMAAGAACCFFALISGQAFASGGAQCWQSYEVEAAKVRDLHIMLMLGALKCNATHPGLADKYEAFTTKQSGLLASYNNVLKTHFMRVGGISDGQAAYEQFNTRLGNSHSGTNQAPSYCDLTETLLTLATDARDRELPQLAQNFSESALGIEAVCEPAAAAPVTGEAMPTTTPAPAAPEAAAVQTAGTEGAPPAPQSAAAALEAAAVALQTAAASLKAAPTEPRAAPKVEKVTHETLPTAQPAVIQPASATPLKPAG